jgi:hypothetical protein
MKPAPYRGYRYYVLTGPVWERERSLTVCRLGSFSSRRTKASKVRPPSPQIVKLRHIQGSGPQTRTI